MLKTYSACKITPSSVTERNEAFIGFHSSLIRALPGAQGIDFVKRWSLLIAFYKQSLTEK